MGRLLIILLFALSASAETIYVSQSGSGSGTGADASNRMSAAGFNTSGNWDTDVANDGKIGPGDTVSLSGTITTTLVFQGSGTAGNVITLQFESGAKMAKGTWNQSGSNGDAAIFGSGVSYIVVKGKGNTTDIDIESTSNGTGLTTSNHSVGVQFNGSNQIMVRDLVVTNMYVRTASSAEDNAVGGCIQFRSGAMGITITNCFVSHANVPIYFDGSSTTCSNWYVLNNWGTHAGQGVLVAAVSSGSGSVTNIIVEGNDFRQSLQWSGQPNIHQNNSHIWASASGAAVRGLILRNNRYGGTWGSNPTSFMFLEGYVYAPKIINNLFVDDAGTFGGNGTLTIKGATNAFVANNTFAGRNQGIAIGTTSFGGGMDGGTVITNNLVYDWAHGVYDTSPQVIGANNNVWYSVDNFTVSGSYSFGNFANWQGSGFDSAGSTSQPTLDANYVPTAADTVAKSVGKDMSAFFTTDYFGVTRSDWYAGYAEYSGDPTAPTLTGFTVGTDGTTGTITFSEAVEQGAGWSGSNFNIDGTTAGDNISITITGGDGTDTWSWSITGTAILRSGSPDLDFDGAANAVESVDDGADLAALTSFAASPNDSYLPVSRTTGITNAAGIP